jgi:predicted SprT family Zn-dependent metalloprotease
MFEIEKIKKRWILQLYNEYESICYQRKVKLQAVIIKISNSMVSLGSWCPARRSISISYDLIFNNNWDIVVEVLKHEMAHQYAWEVLHYYGSHGSEFLQACDVLGVDLWASKASISLDDYQKHKKNTSENGCDKTLRRVKKLLALTSSCNKNEARIALQKVKEISYDERFLLEEKFSTVIINHNLKKIKSEQMYIADILVRFFNVKIIYSSLYNPKSFAEEKTLEIIAEATKLKIAEYVYWYLLNNVNLLWKDYKAATKIKGLRLKNEFISGVLTGFAKQLKEKTENKLPQEKSLAISLSNKRLDNFIKRKYPRMHTVSYNKSSNSNEVYQAGHSKGMKLSIHDGVKAKNSYTKRIGP